MAKLIKKHRLNTLTSKRLKCRTGFAICALSAVACCILAFFCYGVSLIPALIFFVFAVKLNNECRILMSGVKGEKSALSDIASLPSSYSVISDVTVSIGKKTIQTDLIVIGPNGVFIVEVKNHGGKIFGHINDRNLIKIKYGKQSEFYNPVMQVGTHVKMLLHMLYDEGIHCPVYGAVYFSNQDTQVNIEGKNDFIRIFSAKEGKVYLLNYIKQTGVALLSKQETDALCRVITRHCS